VTDYLEHALPAQDQARFEDHISRCVGCSNYLAQMQRTIQVMGKLSEESIAPQARDDLLRAFRDWKRA